MAESQSFEALQAQQKRQEEERNDDLEDDEEEEEEEELEDDEEEDDDEEDEESQLGELQQLVELQSPQPEVLREAQLETLVPPPRGPPPSTAISSENDQCIRKCYLFIYYFEIVCLYIYFMFGGFYFESDLICLLENSALETHVEAEFKVSGLSFYFHF